jgi:hypothetical protein
MFAPLLAICAPIATVWALLTVREINIRVDTLPLSQVLLEAGSPAALIPR